MTTTNDTLARARAAIARLREVEHRRCGVVLDADGARTYSRVTIDGAELDALLRLAEAARWRRSAEIARAAMAEEPLDYEGAELDDQRARLRVLEAEEAEVAARWGPTVDAALAELTELAGDEEGKRDGGD